MIEVGIKSVKIPHGEVFKNSLIEVFGTPLSGKTSFSISLGFHIAYVLNYTVHYIDLSNEITPEYLSKWNFINSVPFFYYYGLNGGIVQVSNYDQAYIDNIKEQPKVYIIDPLPVLSGLFQTTDILSLLMHFLNSTPGNTVIYINHTMGNGIAWYDNLFRNYAHFRFVVKCVQNDEHRFCFKSVFYTTKYPYSEDANFKGYFIMSD